MDSVLQLHTATAPAMRLCGKGAPGLYPEEQGDTGTEYQSQQDLRDQDSPPAVMNTPEVHCSLTKATILTSGRGYPEVL